MPFLGTFRIGKSIEMENRLVLPGAEGGGDG